MVLARSLLICQTFQVFFGGIPYAVNLLPKGNSRYCCEINLEEDIIFMMHYRSGPPRRASVLDGVPGLDPCKDTVMYIHGFTEQGTGEGPTAVKDAYFHSGREVNFLTVDWAKLCAFPYYTEAVANTLVAGRYLSLFIDRLILDGCRPESIHLIGFSLGAEVAGFAGKLMTLGPIGRITGLDPAFPLYQTDNAHAHLSSTDAKFVDVIHTDAGRLGFPIVLGHVDFYPNGGTTVQPGCSAKDTINKKTFPPEFVACSHRRAWQFYAESVFDPEGFPAICCPSMQDYCSGKCILNSNASVTVMGYAASKSARGMYFLETNSCPPYAQRCLPNGFLRNVN